MKWFNLLTRKKVIFEQNLTSKGHVYGKIKDSNIYLLRWCVTDAQKEYFRKVI